jgi:hypothetical protein
VNIPFSFLAEKGEREKDDQVVGTMSANERGKHVQVGKYSGEIYKILGSVPVSLMGVLFRMCQ